MGEKNKKKEQPQDEGVIARDKKKKKIKMTKRISNRKEGRERWRRRKKI